MITCQAGLVDQNWGSTARAFRVTPWRSTWSRSSPCSSRTGEQVFRGLTSFIPTPVPSGSAVPAEAHDVFEGRYSRYSPKLTAVTYYDLVNSILDKKFVAAKDYGDTHLFLFRNRDNHSLIVAWKDKGRVDAGLPLPGVGKIDIIRIDSRRRTLDAGGKGVTLTFDEDPILMTFDGARLLCPTHWALPKLRSTLEVPAGLVRGIPSDIVVALAGRCARRR